MANQRADNTTKMADINSRLVPAHGAADWLTCDSAPSRDVSIIDTEVIALQDQVLMLNKMLDEIQRMAWSKLQSVLAPTPGYDGKGDKVDVNSTKHGMDRSPLATRLSDIRSHIVVASDQVQILASLIKSVEC